MNSEFVNILHFITSNDKKRKELMNDIDFKMSISPEKMLLISEPSNYGELLTTGVLEVIQTGMDEKRCMRDILPVIAVPEGYEADITYSTSPTDVAEYVAEGAAIPIDIDDYSITTITLNKAATRPMITREMVEDGKYGMIELELKKAGARLENKLNQEAISTLLDDADGSTPADTDPAGTHIAMIDIGLAYGDLADIGWKPTDLILHPQASGYIQSGATFDVNYDVGKLWGLDTHILDSVVNDDATNHWKDTDAATNYTGLILDKSNYAVIAMKKDISVDKFDDPINDLVGMIVSMRFGCGVLNDSAAVRILAK